MSVKTRALLLDFGGVISRTLFETHAMTEQALGLAPGSLTWQGPFDPASDPLWVAMQNNELTEREYWQQRTLEVSELAGERWEEMSQFIIAARGADPALIIRPEALDAMAKAQAGGARLAILSNELDLFYGAGFRDKLPFMRQFEVVIDATYTKIMKPDPRAYYSCAEALGLACEDCIFVDDQLRNIVGAKQVGMQTVHFNVQQPRQSYEQALSLLLDD
ncbi:MAG: HAD-IA family hydrolase [Porticoccaceae bacterium]|jgi:putative hydrolase of the HAD superfamily|nr:HAD-IA family hydrolase [Porticoccaceae bacterium]MBT4592108.1 HAD-IA family hydrolase [Porticoccaceae bacterium]MBT6026661.1 HAD-IA family hydrolase [Porticoccaceae bacterium]MBT6422201.1 HAD-IA family hydrolase [Porticoccaceae bacterium]MBT6799711.1 HAD-IA family hydrolase [Porticoccaceae bacterium]